MKMKKWEAIELQNSAINFILDVSNNKWIFTDMTLGTFLQPLKDSKEHWIFFTEMIYKLYKCDMIEFPDDEEFPVRLLVGLPGSLEEFWTNSIEEFCCLLANRFEYRKTDMAYQPYIYPKEKYRKLIEKHEENIHYISSHKLNEDKIDEIIENTAVNEEFIEEIEKIFEENGVVWKDKEKFLISENFENKETSTAIETKKNREETFDSIRDWLITTIRENDNIIFPKEELLERVKLFDEAEKLRTYNAIKFFVEREDYHMKFKEGEVLQGNEILKAFEKILEISVIGI